MRHEINDELKKELEGSLLGKTDKDQLKYHVPEGYFDTLTEKALEDEKGSKYRNPKMIYWMSLASSLLLLITFYSGFSDSESRLFDNTDDEMLLEYAFNEMELEEVDLFELTENTPTNRFENITTQDIDLYIQNQTDIVELEELIEFL